MKLLLLSLFVSTTLALGVLLTSYGVAHNRGWFLAFGLSCLFAIPPWTCALAMKFLWGTT